MYENDQNQHEIVILLVEVIFLSLSKLVKNSMVHFFKVWPLSNYCSLEHKREVLTYSKTFQYSNHTWYIFLGKLQLIVQTGMA